MRSTPIFLEGLGFESCVKYLVDEKCLSAPLAKYFVIEVSRIHVRLNFIHQPLKRSKLRCRGHVRGHFVLEWAVKISVKTVGLRDNFTMNHHRCVRRLWVYIIRVVVWPSSQSQASRSFSEQARESDTQIPLSWWAWGKFEESKGVQCYTKYDILC